MGRCRQGKAGLGPVARNRVFQNVMTARGTEHQTNEWLMRYLLRYDDQLHRSQAQSRGQNGRVNLPAEGICGRAGGEMVVLL